MRCVLVALLVVGCGGDKATATDTGARDTTVDGTDGTDGNDGTDGTDEPDYTAFSGYQTRDVYGPHSDTPDLCQVVWLTVGRAVSTTCDDCVWSFRVTGSYDEALSAVGACGDPDNFTITYASDGDTLFYEYGDEFVPLATVDLWEPDGHGYNFVASQSAEDDGYTTVHTVAGQVH